MKVSSRNTFFGLSLYIYLYIVIVTGNIMNPIHVNFTFLESLKKQCF